jgi:hypothetical protein
MEKDHLFELNYAICLCTHGELDSAREHFKVLLLASIYLFVYLLLVAV